MGMCWTSRARPRHNRFRTPWLCGLLVALGSLAVPDAASAQFWRQLGFGANIGLTEPIDGDVDGALVLGGSGGMAPEHGWGFAASLGWFEADLIDGRGADSRSVGELKVRPLMAGVGYTWHNGRFATTASLTAGISLNGGTLDDALRQESPGAALDVGNSFAIRPAIEVEYFLTRKFALTGAAGFLFTRPEITLTTPESRLTDRWNASSFNLLAGVVVYPFR